MKYTLLEIVQKVLSSLDSDAVNSISDTGESSQIVDLAQTTYFDIVSIGELPRDDDLFQLTASGDATLPVTMTLPNNVTDIRWIKYNNATTADTDVLYQPVYPMPLIDFVEMVTGLDPDVSNVDTYSLTTNGNTFTLYCNNDRAPKYYTTTNDNTILFDSYDSAVDTTLQSSKTMVFGQRTFPWQATDNFIPPLDDKQMQRWLHETKALAFAELKQTPHLKAEKMARDIKIDQQTSKSKIPTQTDYDLIPNLGRRGPRGKVKPTGRY